MDQSLDAAGPRPVRVSFDGFYVVFCVFFLKFGAFSFFSPCAMQNLELRGFDFFESSHCPGCAEELRFDTQACFGFQRGLAGFASAGELVEKKNMQGLTQRPFPWIKDLGVAFISLSAWSGLPADCCISLSWLTVLFACFRRR